METNKGDHSENNRAEEDLGDVIVENFLVGVRGVQGLGFFLVRCFNVEEGVSLGRYVLFGVHGDCSLIAKQGFPCVLRVFMGEFPHF